MATLEDVTAIVRDLGEKERARLDMLVIAGALTGLHIAMRANLSLQMTAKLMAHFICGILKTEGRVLEETILVGENAIGAPEKKEP